MSYTSGNLNGQATMANSESVVIASDQTPVKVALSQGTQEIFGSIVTSSRINQIYAKFHTGVISNLINLTTSGTGAATIASAGNAQFSTGTGTTSQSKGNTLNNTTYVVGSEVYVEFTAAFTTPTSAASLQRIGLYDTNNGFYVGFNGLNFGVGVRNQTSDTNIIQSSFNLDTLSGVSTSQFTRNGVPEAINLTYANLYRIRFGWLGSAPIVFEVVSPDGNWVAFHLIRQPNTISTPSIANPDLPITLDVSKTASDATNLIVSTGAWSAGCASDGPSELHSSGAITSTQSILLNIGEHKSVGVEITGTWAGTLVFEGLINTTWNSIDIFKYSTELIGSSITTNDTGSFVNLGGFSQVRVRGNTVVSGTANIYLTAVSTQFEYPLFARGQGSTIGSYGIQLGGVDPSLNTFQFQKVNTLGAAAVFLESSNKASYSATIVPVTPPATPSDIITLYGSATKIIRILKLTVNTTQTTIGINDWYLVKRSTANSGGTSAAITSVPLDSNFAAATAVLTRYTANPTTLGTLVGNLNIVNIISPPINPGTSSSAYVPYVFDFTNNPIVLRGVAQGVAINFNGAALPAGLSVNFSINWTEE